MDGAKPSILIKGNPEVRVTYRKEYYPGEAADMGKVVSLDESATVPYGFFDHN